MSLPTEPGPYWWREKDDDRWKLYDVGYGTGTYTNELIASLLEIDTKGRTGLLVRSMQGQWAKAYNPDEGVDAWAVFNQTTGEMLVSWLDKDETQEMCDNMNRMSQKYHYTCEPVTIYRKEKE